MSVRFPYRSSDHQETILPLGWEPQGLRLLPGLGEGKLLAEGHLLLGIAKLVEYGPEAPVIDTRSTLKNAVLLVAFAGREEIIIVSNSCRTLRAGFE